MQKMIRTCFTAFWATALVVACGGGGDSPAPMPVPRGPSVTVQGTVNYERVAPLAGGALDYSQITALPVRGATIELLSGVTVVASAQTDESGRYVFSAPVGGTSVSVRVRAELKKTSGPGQWDVTVRDNTNGNALYTMASSVFVANTGTVQNLTASSGWGSTSYTGNRTAGPFAILDTIYLSQQKVLQASPDAVFPRLEAFWSVNNGTAAGDPALGNIEFSFFLQEGAQRQLYILGRQNDDTDEYDASVVAHEWGHYYQSAFSRDDSVGGRHGGFDDRLDRRVAFSEGWGNAWSGIALAQNTYRDSSGPTQGSGFSLPLNSGYSSTISRPKGWFREQSIQYLLWDLNRQVGFSPLHTALTSSAFKTGTPLTDIHSFAAAFKSVASSTQAAVLDALLTSESINSSSNSFGNNETNTGGSLISLPYYRQITALGSPATLASGQTVCVSSAFDGGGDRNKLAQYAYLRFSTPSAGNRSFTITSTGAGVDTDFEVHSAGVRVLLADTGVTNSETASVNLTAGEHVLVVYDFNSAAGTPCFTISIQ